jgi:hypothetical protein
MKKLFSFVLLVLLICSSIAVFGADFRNVNWRMSKEEVVAIESQPQFKGTYGYRVPENMLVYNNQKVGDLNCQLQYIFLDNKLVMAQYIPIMEIEKTKFTLNPFRHIDTPAEVYEKSWVSVFDNYVKLKNLLIIKYGAPSDDTQKWTSETWKNIGGSIPYHVVKGHLIVNAKWDLGGTIIYLDCERNNKYTVEVLLDRLCYYESEYYKSLIPKEPVKEDLKNL